MLQAFQFLNSLRPAIPFSIEKPCSIMSNAEFRRCIEQKAVLINGEIISINEEINFPVFSIVFFPKSASRKTTIM